MKKVSIINKYHQFKEHPNQFVKYIFNISLYNIVRYRILRKRDYGKCAYLNYPPKYISIMITGYCTNSCQFCACHCIDSGRDERSKHQYNIPYSLDYKTFCKIVDMCYTAKVPHVHIVAAGEPFLHKEVFKMIDYLTSRYCKFTTQTNFNKKIFESGEILKEILKRKNLIKYITSDIFAPDIHNIIKKGSDYEFLLDTMEYLSKKGKILFDLHTILTKQTYKNLDKVILDLYKRKIKFTYTLVNLHPHNFNKFTSKENRYMSTDKEITIELQKLRKLADKLKINLSIPLPWDKEVSKDKGYCLTFWDRFQLIPDKNLPKEKWIGNVVPSQCNAVVLGDLYSLGNLFEHKNLMDFWNNKKLLEIRRNLINRKYPDKMCITCYKYNDNFRI